VDDEDEEQLVKKKLEVISSFHLLEFLLEKARQDIKMS
jgi:hypothetical protein